MLFELLHELQYWMLGELLNKLFRPLLRSLLRPLQGLLKPRFSNLQKPPLKGAFFCFRNPKGKGIWAKMLWFMTRTVVAPISEVP